MRFLTMLAAAVLAVLGAAGPALAQDVSKTRAAEIEVTFNPPLDVAQRFRVTRSKTRGGKAEVTASWIEELRFARDGDNFILYWRMVWDTLPPEMRHPAVAPMTRPFAQEPIAFDLDSEGTVLRVRDWAAVRPKLVNVARNAGTLLDNGQKDKAATDRAVAQVSAMFESMDAEAGASMILKNIDPILGWGGIAMRVGETRTTSGDVPIPLFGTPLTQTVAMTMVSADPGRSTAIRMITEMDPASVRKLIATLMARFPANDPKRRAEMEREAAAIEQLSVVDTTAMTIDLATGLPTRLDNRRVANADGTEQVETLLIEWLR